MEESNINKDRVTVFTRNGFISAIILLLIAQFSVLIGFCGRESLLMVAAVSGLVGFLIYATVSVLSVVLLLAPHYSMKVRLSYISIAVTIAVVFTIVLPALFSTFLDFGFLQSCNYGQNINSVFCGGNCE